jgi:hypothetical protein
MIGKPALSIITTTDPVARQLSFLLRELSSLAIERNDSYEVIIVDDLGQWEIGTPPNYNFSPHLLIRIIQLKQRQGQLKAVQRGLEEATTPLMLTIDPDLHQCVSEIPYMTDMLNENIMAVHAVRTKRTDVGRFRKIASCVVNMLVRNITGLQVRDIGSPITLLKRDVLDMIPPASAGRQLNMRLRIYLELGNKLACYNLKNGTKNNTPSHYDLIHLIHTSWRLLRDAVQIRFHSASKKHRQSD